MLRVRAVHLDRARICVRMCCVCRLAWLQQVLPRVRLITGSCLPPTYAAHTAEITHILPTTIENQCMQVRAALEAGKPFTPLYTQPQEAPAWAANEASHEARGPSLAAHLSLRAAAVRVKQVRHGVVCCLSHAVSVGQQMRLPMQRVAPA